MSDNKITVLDTLKKSQEPLKAGEVADMTGISKDNVSKLIKELQKDGKVESPKRCFYKAVE